MKIALLFVALFSLSFATPIILQDGFSPLSTAHGQINIEDATASLSAEDILQERYTSLYSKHFTSYTRSVFWAKVILKNSSDTQQHVIFRNQRAGTDKIDVYIYHKKMLKNSYTLGDMRDHKLHPLSSVKSTFPLVLASGEEVCVITRFESLGAKNLDWEILRVQDYSYSNIMEMIFYAAFGGVILALILYNFVMFLNLKEKTFLFYTLHGVSVLWVQYAYNGMFYFLDTGINLSFLTLSTWFVAVLMILFFLFFTLSFFKVRENNKKIYPFFVALIVINFVVFLLSLYQLIDSSLVIYTLYMLAITFISLVFIFFFALYSIYKHYEGALYFLIGEGVYLGALTYVIFINSGSVAISSTLQYTLVPLALLLEMVLLSIALGKRVGDMKRDNNFKSKLLVEEEKFVSIGKTIGDITHQWKEPISQLSSQLMYLESLHHLKKEKMLLCEFGSKIEQMNSVLTYMKASVNDLYDFYSNSDHNGYFNLKKQIEMACKLQSENLILSHVAISVDCSEKIFVLGAKHALSNILMILFDNSIYQLKLTGQSAAKISIAVHSLKEGIRLSFSDNGGGIDPKKIKKIFTTPYTTKGKDGCGLGLSLSKKLVQERLHGTIEVKNHHDGALFTLSLQEKEMLERGV